MKFNLYILLLCFAVSSGGAQFSNKIFPNLGKSNTVTTAGSGNVTYIYFSNSINGPYTSPANLLTTDSLFVKADVTPYDTVYAEYFLDADQNGTVDVNDLSFGSDRYVDNNATPPGIIDLDPAPGVIVASVPTGGDGKMPSMHILVRATEGMSSATGLVIFENLPKTYNLSGTVYSTEGGTITGVMVWVGQEWEEGAGDISDADGHYSVPVDEGTYNVHIGDISVGGRYESFDTTMAITGNTTHDFYLSPLTSYIRGYVRDQDLNPIPDVDVWASSGGDAYTDINGMYTLMVASGSGYIGLSSESLLPAHLYPTQHDYTIGPNDSIVNNSVSNFTCYAANAAITGTVRENGEIPGRLYKITAWSWQLESNSAAVTDVSGGFTLPVYDAMTMPLYSVQVSEWDDDYPFPPGMYIDTDYWDVSPGSAVDFNFLPAETSYSDPFTGNDVNPSFDWWDMYSAGSPTGWAVCKENRLEVACISNSGWSGLGVISQKPFSVRNREYRVKVDASGMAGTLNTIRIMFADKDYNWSYPENYWNSVQLIWEKSGSGLRQWRLAKSQNGSLTDLCTSSDSTGQDMVFRFVDPDTLKFSIDGMECFSGSIGSVLSLAYVYLTSFNTAPNTPATVYFDDFYVGDFTPPVGVREIGGLVAREFRLEQNYPNPFNPATVIRYNVPVRSTVKLALFNVLGQEVAVLVNGEQSAGVYEAVLAANGLPSGVYFYRLSAVDLSAGKTFISDLRKAVLLK